MKPGERIRHFRKNKGLNQTEFAERMGYSQTFLSDIEIGKVEPSREFLKKLNEVFGISSDYILYSGTGAQWEKIDTILKDCGLNEEKIQEVKGTYVGGLFLAGREDWERGHRYGLAVHDPDVKYKTYPTSTKKLIDNMVEILESGNETMINALKSNIKAFLEAVYMNQKKNEDKGGD